MKKKAIALLLAGVVLVGCGNSESTYDAVDGTESEQTFEETVDETVDETETDEESSESDTATRDENLNADISAASDEIMSKLATIAGAGEDKLFDYVVDDYNYDGLYEAFAFVGDYNESDGILDGDLWYCDGKVAQKLASGSFWHYDDTDGSKTLVDVSGHRKYYCVYDYSTTDSVTHLWSVKQDAPVEMFVGGSLDKWDQDGNMTFTFSMYDMMYDSEIGDFIGHTWKPYYFYYDEASDEIREYGADEISEDQLTTILGYDLASEIRAAGYEVGEIFSRKNGIININYNDGENYDNANYDVTGMRFLGDGASADTWQEIQYGYGGSYKAAIRPDIATYPE